MWHGKYSHGMRRKESRIINLMLFNNEEKQRIFLNNVKPYKSLNKAVEWF